MIKSSRLIIIILLLLSCVKTYAQDAIHIAILPFDATDRNANGLKDVVQDAVTSCFANKGRFFLLDRAVTEKLKAELENSKQASSAYARIVADQGHLANAQYLISGRVSPLDVGSSTSTYEGKTTTSYHGTLHVTLQINTVETGKIFDQETISVTSQNYNTNSNGDMVDNALCRLKVEVQKKVRMLFASSITIVGVEKEKKGIPQKVIVNAGQEIFDKGKNSGCEGVSAKGSALSLSGFKEMFGSNKVYMDIVCLEEYKYGNITSKRERKIGELKIDEVQGDITVCSVTKGDKELKAAMDDKKQLVVRIQTQ